MIERTVAELVVERPSRARLFEHLGIDYCCGGGRSLADACGERDLDPGTVEALLGALDSDGSTTTDWAAAPLGDLCDHIVDVHHGYLRRELPRLSGLLDKCARAHGLTDLQAAFEELRGALEPHLEEEERSLFPPIRAGERISSESAAAFVDEHVEVGGLLARLSQLTGGYDRESAHCNTHRAAIDALAELERDIHEHVHEENNILIPRATA